MIVEGKMNKAQRIVKVFMKPTRQVLRKSEVVIIPTKDCPLPDKTDDLTDLEWVMLCSLVTEGK